MLKRCYCHCYVGLFEHYNNIRNKSIYSNGLMQTVQNMFCDIIFLYQNEKVYEICMVAGLCHFIYVI